MHLVCLGVVKKLLMLLIQYAPLKLRISRRVKRNGRSAYDVINTSILNCVPMIPDEFNRKCRTLDLVKRWKATELRTFLLYIGPLVLLNNISTKQYEQFLALNVAMTIFLSPELSEKASFAHTLLQYFVKSFSNTYGNYLISHNVHGLLHLYDDYLKFGPLNNVNCFSFENYMQIIKHQIRKPGRPLKQLINRYNENPMFSLQNKNSSIPTAKILALEPHKKGPILNSVPCVTQFAKLKINDAILKIKSVSTANCYFISSSNEVVEIHNIVHTLDNKYVILGHTFKATDWYDKPLKSSLLSVFKLGELSTSLNAFPIDKFKKKCLVLETNNNKVAMPLIHSLY